MKQVEYNKIILQILSLIRVIVGNSRLYGFGHTHIETQLGQLFNGFNAAFSVRPELTIMLIENDLVINNRAVKAVDQKSFGLFVKILQEKDVGYMTFSKGMKKSELLAFLVYLAKPSSGEEQPISSPYIEVGGVGLRERKRKGFLQGVQEETGRDGSDGGEPVKGRGHNSQEVQNALKVLNSIATDRLDVIKDYYEKIERFGQCEFAEVESVISVFAKCFSKSMNPLAMLATQKEADDYTFTHVVNVSILTLAQAAGLGFSGDTLLEIGVAASLHDVGKIFVPPELLNKTGKLSSAEREAIMLHPAKGASYLLGMKNISRLAFLAALEHHIRFDGSGYPKTGGKWKPHLVSQMVAISDTFDAMRSNRPYQKARPLEKIFSVLNEGKGTVYNPMLVNNFIRVIQSQPRFTGI